MSDAQQQDPAQFRFTIDFNARTGAIEVNGPIDQDVLCYGILERAKQVVWAHALKRRQEQRVAVIGHPLPPEFRRR